MEPSRPNKDNVGTHHQKKRGPSIRNTKSRASDLLMHAALLAHLEVEGFEGAVVETGEWYMGISYFLMPPPPKKP